VKDTIVASRYARALFIVTEKRGETGRALEDLKALVPVLDPAGPVGSHLALPQLRMADRRAAMTKALEGRVVRVVQLFLDLLLRKRRLNELAAIATEFEALVERALGVQRAHVVSAVAMTDAEVQRLQAALERTTKSNIKLTREVDADLLGGALVRIGDHVIDRSARTLLDVIEKQLHEVSV
jgi:F-type H+-transporting ATPase subunit delta